MSIDRRAGRCRHWKCVAGLCQQAPEFPRRRGAGAKENTTTNQLVGLRPTNNDVTHGGVARRLGLLLVHAVSVRIARGRIPELKFSSSTEGIQVDRCGGRGVRWGGSLKRGVPTGSAWSGPDGMGTVRAGEAAGAGTVTTARGDGDRGTRGGMLTRRADGRRAPPGPKP